MLTKKQQELLAFIDDRLSASGVSPSFEEMKQALGLRSKSGVHRLITALEERGFIRRLPNRARALEVVRKPGDAPAAPVATAGPTAARAGLSVVTGGAPARPEPPRAPLAPETIDLPVLGRIAAGTPIEAIQHEVDRFAAPSALVGTGDHYILEVQGESMIEAGIHDGDLAIIQRRDDAPTGDIVVALVDGEEATLKRLRKKGASVALEAANPAFETRIYGAERVAVQGRLVGLMRRY
ncbi:MAG: transcriptional repressor LexA [Pseudomonadota bacterium]